MRVRRGATSRRPACRSPQWVVRRACRATAAISSVPRSSRRRDRSPSGRHPCAPGRACPRPRLSRVGRLRQLGEPVAQHLHATVHPGGGDNWSERQVRTHHGLRHPVVPFATSGPAFACVNGDAEADQRLRRGPAVGLGGLVSQGYQARLGLVKCEGSEWRYLGVPNFRWTPFVR